MNRVRPINKAEALNQHAPADSPNSGEEAGSATDVETADAKFTNTFIEGVDSQTGEQENSGLASCGESIEGAASVDTETLAVPAHESDIERP